MARCARIKDNGERCRADAMPGAEWCYSHHPDYQEQRRRNASKGGKAGGRGRPASLSDEVAQIKRQLRHLATGVLTKDAEKRLERADAVAVNQILNTLLRAIEVERRVHETEELEERLAELEKTIA